MLKGRVLAVDPGSKRIGIAISDPTRTLANPVTVFKHVSLEEDCQKIIGLCNQLDVKQIIVGNALSENGEVNPAMRHAQKVAKKLEELGNIPVLLWDESGSTKEAIEIHKEMGGRCDKRSRHLDDKAAAFFLQSYLDSVTMDGVL